MSASQAAASATTNTGQAFGTKGYRNYVLISLTLLYTLNFVDRVLIQVLAQPIIDEFQLQDWQFGLLAGLGFALFYTAVGIPIALLAEKWNRVRIIAFSVIIWSVMTALCGFATGFITLLIFRVGVGIGEAGLTPPANSIIADYFPPKSRARAMGTYAMGVTLGGVLAAAFGGPINDIFDWRTAFIVLGAPGIVFGLIFLFTTKEPPRGYSDPPGTEKKESAGILDALASVGAKPTFWVNVAAATLVAFVGYGVSAFQVAYFQRAFEMTTSEAAFAIAVPAGLAASLGIYGAGWLTERMSTKTPNAVVLIPGFSLVLSVPFYLIGFSTGNVPLAIVTLIFGALFHYTYLGAQYTVCQGVADTRSRATAVAIMLFIINIIGYGAGPLFVGWLSDVLITADLSSSTFGAELTTEMCKGKAEDLIAVLGEAKANTCLQANADGLGGSILVTVTLYAVCGLLYLLCGRTLQNDLVAKLN